VGKKQKWWDRLDFVTRNITASMDATDADVRDLADRVAALERSISSDPAGQSADLRTRIAAVLSGYVDHSHRYDLADMLMRDIPELQARCDCQARNWAADE